MPLTITEALAEIKTIAKRVEKKRESINQYLARREGAKDPLEKDGGSMKFIASERQSVSDLEDRTVALRRGIQMANETTKVVINEQSRTISDWLIWRRDVAPKQKEFLANLRKQLNGFREQARREGANMVTASAVAEKATDIVVNVDEQALAKEIETLEEVIGTLDGQLSLKNATVIIQE